MRTELHWDGHFWWLSLPDLGIEVSGETLVECFAEASTFLRFLWAEYVETSDGLDEEAQRLSQNLQQVPALL